MTATLDLASTSPVPGAAATAILVDHLHKRLDDRLILRDLSFAIPAGQTVAILGANGAGKSTLLNVLSTLTTPSAGRVRIFDQPLKGPTARAMIGYIAHQPMIYRELSAAENLRLFGQLFGLSDVNQRVAAMLQMVGLSHRANDPVKAFSRGMLQRVAIARSLLHDPKILLADEPFTGLDAPSIASFEDLLAQLSQAGKTVLLVNHDIGQSLKLAHRAILLRNGEIVEDAPARGMSVERVLNLLDGTDEIK